MYINTDDLTEEEINFLLSDEAEAEMFIFRQEFGPVHASSYRFWANHKLAENIVYTPADIPRKNAARFKAGKALADTVPELHLRNLNLKNTGNRPISLRLIG